jgi:hypothetical protein
MQNENNAVIPCCPEFIKDDHCDQISFSRLLNYPASSRDNRANINVEVILRFKLSRCTLGLTVGDPAFSTTLLPGEKVRIATTDRRSRFTYDSETKLSYRSEQISEEQYFMTATQKYMADAAAAQSGNASSSSEGHWDFHGDAHGSINPFGLSAGASSNASGNHNSSSVSDYLNEQKSHVQSSAAQAVDATRKAHSISIGEVSTRSHIEGVTYMFYRINKKQRVKFELVSIERRIRDDNAPIRGILQADLERAPIALVPQDIPATVMLKRSLAPANATLSLNADAQTLLAARQNLSRPAFSTNQNYGSPMDEATRAAALKEVDEQLVAKNLLGKDGKVSVETKLAIDFETEFSLPTPGIIVKGCLDECDVCEPLLKERMQLENDLLRKQIQLLDKSQEYLC